jgi:peptide alpha-N-acetyltransferase
MPVIQECNISCLQENYTFKYYYYHVLSWPDLLYVAEDISTKKVVGYVLAKVDDEDESENKEVRGHITSISVLRDYRRLGIAKRLMDATHRAMKGVYNLNAVTLHVRVSNIAAMGLYRDRLGYGVVELDEAYYADGENAFLMRKTLTESY